MAGSRPGEVRVSVNRAGLGSGLDIPEQAAFKGAADAGIAAGPVVFKTGEVAVFQAEKPRRTSQRPGILVGSAVMGMPSASATVTSTWARSRPSARSVSVSASARSVCAGPLVCSVSVAAILPPASKPWIVSVPGA